MEDSSTLASPGTLSFLDFWRWLTAHPNCILRAGTTDSVLYDQEDFYWHFGSEETGTLLVQVVRGKRMIGEIFVDPEEIDYVESSPGEMEGEFLFQLVSEVESGPSRLFFFGMVHAYDEAGAEGAAHVH